MATKKINLDISERLNITCRRGDTFNMVVTLKDSTGTGLEIVQGQYTFVMQVRDAADSDGVTGMILSTLEGRPSGAGGGTIGSMKSDGTEGGTYNVDDSGNVTIYIADTTMKAVAAGRYVYDLQYVIPDSANGGADDTHTTILRGSFVVNEDVTEYSA